MTWDGQNVLCDNIVRHLIILEDRWSMVTLKTHNPSDSSHKIHATTYFNTSPDQDIFALPFALTPWLLAFLAGN